MSNTYVGVDNKPLCDMEPMEFYNYLKERYSFPLEVIRQLYENRYIGYNLYRSTELIIKSGGKNVSHTEVR